MKIHRRAMVSGILLMVFAAAGMAAQEAPLQLAMPGTAGPFTVFDESKGISKGGTLVHFREDSSGAVWMYSQKGVWRFNGTTFEKQDSRGAANLKKINDMSCDKAGNVWLDTNDGLVVHTSSGEWKNIDKNASFASPVFRNREGVGYESIWSKTEEGRRGVGVYKTERVTDQIINNLLTTTIYWHNETNRISSPDAEDLSLGTSISDWKSSFECVTRSGAVWNALYNRNTGQGKLLIRSSETAKIFPGIGEGDAWEDKWITDMHEDPQGRMWISYGEMFVMGKKDGGVFVIDSLTGQVTNIPMGDKKDYVCNIFSDSSGTLWFSALHGLDGRMLQRDGNSWRVIFDSDSEMRVTSVFEDSHHNLWMGTTPWGWVIKYKKD